MRIPFLTTFVRSLLLFSLIAAPALTASPADAARLQRIEHKSLGAGSEEVRLNFDEAVEPKVFTMDGGKPRVVLDFPGADRTADVRNLAPKSAVVRAVRVGVDKNRTRVVCDVAFLDGLSSSVRVEGGQVVISLNGPGAAAAPAAPAETAAAPEQAAVPARLAPARKVRGPGATHAVVEDGPAEIETPAAPESSAAAPAAPIAPPPVPEQHAAAEPPAAPPVPAPPTGPAAPAASADAVETPYLSAIQFDPDSPRGELVQFKLNGFYPPVLRSVESGAPQVICEFNNLEVAPALEGPIKLNGRLVKAIRLDKSPTDGKVRVFVELEPNKHYDLQQVFFKEDNFFVLMVNTAKQ